MIWGRPFRSSASAKAWASGLAASAEPTPYAAMLTDSSGGRCTGWLVMDSDDARDRGKSAIRPDESMRGRSGGSRSGRSDLRGTNSVSVIAWSLSESL